MPHNPTTFLDMADSAFRKYASSEGLGTEPWDVILLETENFVVVPTRGAIVAGWLLVIPKEPVLSFGHIGPSLLQEAKHVFSQTRSLVFREYGSAVAFEHGPCVSTRPVGCGVDHAHIHVLPSVCDLKRGAEDLLTDISWIRASSISDATRLSRSEKEYLYLREASGQSWLGTHPNIPSQLFRKVVAKSIGEPDLFDWKEYPRRENAELTASALSSYNAEVKFSEAPAGSQATA